jgi:hypothetical protein
MFHSFNIESEFRKFLLFCYNYHVSKVSDIICRDEYLTPIGDWIKPEPEDGYISYVPVDKVLISSGYNDTKYRIKIKIGRFISKLIREEYVQRFQVNNQDIETFVNIYKSYFSNDISKFKVIEGSDIFQWYLDKNYHMPDGKPCGTLWNSCMRYSDRNKFMELYAQNPNKIKMLINLEENGKLRSRALLWEECVSEDGKVYKVMDRIYSIYDHDVTSFKTWAKENGYIYKVDQTSKNEIYFQVDNTNIALYLNIHLDNHKLKYYPYIDTFKFYNPSSGVFSNWNSIGAYVLIQSNGSLVNEPPPPEEHYYDDLDETVVDIG